MTTMVVTDSNEFLDTFFSKEMEYGSGQYHIRNVVTDEVEDQSTASSTSGSEEPYVSLMGYQSHPLHHQDEQHHSNPYEDYSNGSDVFSGSSSAENSPLIRPEPEENLNLLQQQEQQQPQSQSQQQQQQQQSQSPQQQQQQEMLLRQHYYQIHHLNHHLHHGQNNGFVFNNEMLSILHNSLDQEQPNPVLLSQQQQRQQQPSSTSSKNEMLIIERGDLANGGNTEGTEDGSVVVVREETKGQSISLDEMYNSPYSAWSDISSSVSESDDDVPSTPPPTKRKKNNSNTKKKTGATTTAGKKTVPKAEKASPSSTKSNTPSTPTSFKKLGVSSMARGPRRTPRNTPTTIEMQLQKTIPIDLKEEDLVSIDLEEISRRAGMTLTKTEERELKRLRRKVKNKMSAAQSRQKRREYLVGLEERIEIMTQENTTLRDQVSKLQQENSQIRSQLTTLQSYIQDQPPTSVTPSDVLDQANLNKRKRKAADQDSTWNNGGQRIVYVFFAFLTFAFFWESSIFSLLFSMDDPTGLPTTRGGMGGFATTGRTLLGLHRMHGDAPTAASPLERNGEKHTHDILSSGSNNVFQEENILSTGFPNIDDYMDQLLATESSWGPLVCGPDWCVAYVDIPPHETYEKTPLLNAFTTAFDSGVTNSIHPSPLPTELRPTLVDIVTSIDQFVTSLLEKGYTTMNIHCDASVCSVQFVR